MKPVQNLLLTFGMFISLLILSIAKGAALPDPSSNTLTEPLSSFNAIELKNVEKLLEREVVWVSKHRRNYQVHEVQKKILEYKKLIRLFKDEKDDLALTVLDLISTEDQVYIPVDNLILAELYAYLGKNDKAFNIIFRLKDIEEMVNQHVWLYSYKFLLRLGAKDLAEWFIPHLPKNEPANIFEGIEEF